MFHLIFSMERWRIQQWSISELLLLKWYSCCFSSSSHIYRNWKLIMNDRYYQQYHLYPLLKLTYCPSIRWKSSTFSINSSLLQSTTKYHTILYSINSHLMTISKLFVVCDFLTTPFFISLLCVIVSHYLWAT